MKTADEIENENRQAAAFEAGSRSYDPRLGPYEPPRGKFVPTSDKVIDLDKHKVVARLREVVSRHHNDRVCLWEHTIKAAIDLLSRQSQAYERAKADALLCYSPDDSASDWADKIKALKDEG